MAALCPIDPVAMYPTGYLAGARRGCQGDGFRTPAGAVKKFHDQDKSAAVRDVLMRTKNAAPRG
jgi:hypothetical protein